MPTIIGIDPHPQHHTAAALTVQGEVQEIRTFPNSAAGLAAFLAWQEGFGAVRLAVEGPRQPFFVEWTTRLWAEGLPVVGIPAQEVRQRRGRRKTDEEDAVLVARVLLAEPERAAWEPPTWLQPLQELTRTRGQLVRQRRRAAAAGAHLPAVQASLDQVLASLDAAIAALERDIPALVRVLTPRLLEETGVGIVLAGVLVAESGDMRRFRSVDAFTTYSGAAPVPRESGGSKRVRVNRGGNRQPNWALSMIARTRLRVDAQTRALVERKEREGKTRREAYRVLQLSIARHLYQVLQEAHLSPSPASS